MGIPAAFAGPKIDKKKEAEKVYYERCAQPISDRDSSAWKNKDSMLSLMGGRDFSKRSIDFAFRLDFDRSGRSSIKYNADRIPGITVNHIGAEGKPGPTVCAQTTPAMSYFSNMGPYGTWRTLEQLGAIRSPDARKCYTTGSIAKAHDRDSTAKWEMTRTSLDPASEDGVNSAFMQEIEANRHMVQRFAVFVAENSDRFIGCAHEPTATVASHMAGFKYSKMPKEMRAMMPPPEGAPADKDNMFTGCLDTAAAIKKAIASMQPHIRATSLARSATTASGKPYFLSQASIPLMFYKKGLDRRSAIRAVRPVDDPRGLIRESVNTYSYEYTPLPIYNRTGGEIDRATAGARIDNTACIAPFVRWRIICVPNGQSAGWILSQTLVAPFITWRYPKRSAVAAQITSKTAGMFSDEMCAPPPAPSGGEGEGAALQTSEEDAMLQALEDAERDAMGMGDHTASKPRSVASKFVVPGMPQGLPRTDSFDTSATPKRKRGRDEDLPLAPSGKRGRVDTATAEAELELELELESDDEKGC
jgi:hypothetical protein